MIQIINKSACCGCAACVQVCPKQCIAFDEDEEGFRYPKVDMSLCIDCGLCERVCPEINKTKERQPLKVYAAKHPNDQIRLTSSSGGIFTLFAEQILADNGVVFGARFDENSEVVHDYTETKDGLAVFRGSKYLQSRVGNAYRQAEMFLKQGRKVLFSGSPCQIAGLKLFLRKEYENLLAVDFVCHGVPSPLVWKLYLGELQQSATSMPISAISFRDKSTGWKRFSILLRDATGEIFYTHKFYHDPYMQAFLANLSLRPSCYACPSKTGRSMSDLTIGDFWGIQHLDPEFDDDKGVGLVMVHSPKYESLMNHSLKVEHSYRAAIQGNVCIEHSVQQPVNRNFFFKVVRDSQSVLRAWKASASKSVLSCCRRFLYRKLGI